MTKDEYVCCEASLAGGALHIHIGEKLRELLEELRDVGLNGVCFPDVQFDGEASADYGILCDLWPDDFGTSYFDYDACCEDFVARVKEVLDDPTVKVTIDGFNCVEAVRK
jgi:hypothetical protein